MLQLRGDWLRGIYHKLKKNVLRPCHLFYQSYYIAFLVCSETDFLNFKEKRLIAGTTSFELVFLGLRVLSA